MIYSENREATCPSTFILAYMWISFFGVVFISYSAVSPLIFIVFCICASVVRRKLRNKTGCVCACCLGGTCVKISDIIEEGFRGQLNVHPDKTL